MKVKRSASMITKNVKALLSRGRPESRVSVSSETGGPTSSGPQSMPRAGGVEEGRDINAHDEASDDHSANPANRGGVHRDESQLSSVETGGLVVLKGTASSTVAKRLLCVVRDSANAFPPLKAVAGGLYFLLESERMHGRSIEALAPRLKSVAVFLKEPVRHGDAREKLRRGRLEEKLRGVCQDLDLFTKQGELEWFLQGFNNADKLDSLLEDIRDAIIEYQTSLQQAIYEKNCRLIESADSALLDRTPHTTGAGYTSGNRQGCLRGTRKDVLCQIERWLDEEDRRIFWLNGPAGSGKSTIAQTFAECSFADGKLGASFFCSRDVEDRSNIQAIFPTLAIQLAHNYPAFRQELLTVLEANPEITQASLCSQLEKLIIAPLKATCIQTLIIIDALDECKDEEPASAILSVLSRYVDQVPRVKFFITGRPETRIRAGFRLELLRPITEVLKLHDVERSSVDADIQLFLQTQLAAIGKTRSDCDLGESWPSPVDIELLCKKSAGLFIYASTAVKFIASPHDLPDERLTLIVSLRQDTVLEGKLGLDILYAQVLERAFHDADPHEQERYSLFKLVVGAVLLAFYPPSSKTLTGLLRGCTPSRISSALRSLHSLLLIPDREVEPIRAFHKSFPDFLTDPERCKDERFFVNPLVQHLNILFSCLDLIKEKSKKKICGLDSVNNLPGRRNASIGSALEYACRFWTKHLSRVCSSGPHVERLKAAIEDFFTTRLLFWIEVLSLTKHLNVSVHALHEIDRWYFSTGDSCQWTNDSQRLILSNFESIRDSPTNLYHYVFPFCPSSSWLHKLYPADSLRVVKVIRGRPNKWGTCTREVPFDRDPEALAHRKDIIAVGLVSGKIVILDAITGSSGAVLSGHSESVTSLAFSIDGTLLVSGSLDGTIKLWDIQTGGVVKTIYALASSVSISPDATTISSGSTCSISLWDVKTGERRHIIDTATAADGVTCLNFPSATLGRLVSVSGGLVQQWDVSGNSTGPITSGHHIDFSSDGKRFVLCDKGPPTIRDTLSGQIIATLHSPGLDFSRCSFSPSDEFVAGVVHATIYVWNVAGAPRLVGTFTPHGSSIFSLVYAFSLISMHSDGKIRFRRIDGHSPDSTTSNAESTGRPRAKIMYTALQGEDGFAISVDLAGTIERWDLSTGLPEVLLQTPEKEDAIGVRLVNGIVIIVHRDHSFDSGWGVSKWDSEAGERLERKPLSGELSILDPTLDRDVGISKDGTTFYVVDSVYIRTWSVLTGENTGSLYHRNHTRTQTPLSINLEGPIIWIRSLGSPKAWGCDLNNLGSPPLGLSDLPSTLRLACLLGAGGARANTGQSRIIDTTSMKEVFRLPERFADPGKAVWDGRYLLVAYDNVELLILDFVHMALL